MLWNLFLIFLSIFGTKVVSNDELESNAVNCTGRRTCKAVLPTLIKISSRNTTVSTTYLNRYYSRLNESEKYRFDGYNRHIQIVIWNPKNDSNFRTTAQKVGHDRKNLVVLHQLCAEKNNVIQCCDFAMQRNC
ncbi:hypothetical protein M3Y94_00676800 [Aphelenchoides besseyi]|nr:hypothetical protein M3Y94_00676800 [Aphelenchoides besseyi]